MADDLKKVIEANNTLLLEIKELLEKNNKPGIDQIEENAKDQIIDFMLTHLNMPFINDEVEKGIYDAILSIIFKVVNNVI